MAAEMQFHEAATIFPMEDETIDELAADIKKHGLQCPVELCDGKIIDGRRRWMACRLAGVKAQTVEVSPDDPIAYVVSLNLHRRHLNPSQRAMAGARAREMYDAAAKERQRAAGGDHKKAVVEKLPQADSSRARDAAGKAVGVSGKTIDHATKVLARAIPGVVKAVDDGKMAVSTAAILASEEPEQQREEIADHLKRMGTKRYTSPHKNAEVEAEPEPGTSRGVGVRHANEAVDCLKRIPKNDALRKRGFQIVTDWIRQNR